MVTKMSFAIKRNSPLFLVRNILKGLLKSEPGKILKYQSFVREKL